GDAFDRAITQLFGRATVPSALAAGLLAALGEETFFRGIVQAELGLVPAALLFALLHGGRGFNLLALWAVLEGLLLGWLYQLSGNLLLPMIAHGVHDTCGILFARYLYKRLLPPAPTLFDWLVKLAKR
ncbi:MAG: CPBP family intramembrane metalloprotease, partial [Chloroflexi bacterium]|nr:CPBP family intramembrane metalloprotease [Chloroflexota bacterium]